MTAKHTILLGQFAKRTGVSVTLLVAILLMLFSSGCNLFDKFQPMFVISLHRFLEDDLGGQSPLQRRVRDEKTETYRKISGASFLNSKRIKSGELKAGPDGRRYGMILILDRTAGSVLYHQDGSTGSCDEFAIMIDGFYVGNGKFPKRSNDLISDDKRLELPPLWSKAEASAIVEYIPKNYEHYKNEYAFKFL